MIDFPSSTLLVLPAFMRMDLKLIRQLAAPNSFDAVENFDVSRPHERSVAVLLSHSLAIKVAAKIAQNGSYLGPSRRGGLFGFMYVSCSPPFSSSPAYFQYLFTLLHDEIYFIT